MQIWFIFNTTKIILLKAQQYFFKPDFRAQLLIFKWVFGSNWIGDLVLYDISFDFNPCIYSIIFSQIHYPSNSSSEAPFRSLSMMKVHWRVKMIYFQSNSSPLKRHNVQQFSSSLTKNPNLSNSLHVCGLLLFLHL